MVRFVACCFVVWGVSGLSAGQGYPVKPVRIVAGAPAGGGADIILRPIAQRLSEALGAQFIIDNRPGAGSTIAAQLVASSPPDGYTLLQASASSFSISPFLFKKPPYDPVNDFTPVTLIATAPLLVAVHPSVPANSVKELVGLARSKPGRLFYASNGKGSFSHFTTEMFARAAGITMVRVPYKGGASAVMSTLSGESQVIVTAIPTLIAQVRASRLRALGVTSTGRSPIMPQTPTVSEAGVPGFESVQWYAIFAPKHTPMAIADKLFVEIRRAGESASVRSSLVQEGAEPAVNGPRALAEFHQADVARWRRVIRESDVVLE
jgi:tripartite-type tricarboxylate transporter receptor subunit TctC